MPRWVVRPEPVLVAVSHNLGGKARSIESGFGYVSGFQAGDLELLVVNDIDPLFEMSSLHPCPEPRYLYHDRTAAALSRCRDMCPRTIFHESLHGLAAAHGVFGPVPDDHGHLSIPVESYNIEQWYTLLPHTRHR
jgi:hypothetical protein